MPELCMAILPNGGVLARCFSGRMLLQERKVAPPDVPTRAQYRPLGQLLALVQRGGRFKPVTVADIKASLASPGGGAAPAPPAARATAEAGGRNAGVWRLPPYVTSIPACSTHVLYASGEFAQVYCRVDAQERPQPMGLWDKGPAAAGERVQLLELMCVDTGDSGRRRGERAPRAAPAAQETVRVALSPGKEEGTLQLQLTVTPPQAKPAPRRMHTAASGAAGAAAAAGPPAAKAAAAEPEAGSAAHFVRAAFQKAVAAAGEAAAAVGAAVAIPVQAVAAAAAQPAEPEGPAAAEEEGAPAAEQVEAPKEQAGAAEAAAPPEAAAEGSGGGLAASAAHEAAIAPKAAEPAEAEEDAAAAGPAAAAAAAAAPAAVSEPETEGPKHTELDTVSSMVVEPPAKPEPMPDAPIQAPEQHPLHGEETAAPGPAQTAAAAGAEHMAAAEPVEADAAPEAAAVPDEAKAHAQDAVAVLAENISAVQLADAQTGGESLQAAAEAVGAVDVGGVEHTENTPAVAAAGDSGHLAAPQEKAAAVPDEHAPEPASLSEEAVEKAHEGAEVAPVADEAEVHAPADEPVSKEGQPAPAAEEEGPRDAADEAPDKTAMAAAAALGSAEPLPSPVVRPAAASDEAGNGPSKESEKSGEDGGHTRPSLFKSAMAMFNKGGK